MLPKSIRWWNDCEWNKSKSHMQKPGSPFLRDFRVLYYFWFDTPKKTKNPTPSPIGKRFGFF